MKVYSMMKKGISPEINALTTVIFVVSIFCVAVYLIVDKIRSLKAVRAKKRSVDL